MTEIGQTIFGLYCIITVLILVGLNIYKMEKNKSRGWELVVFIPLLVFLVNVI